MDLHSSRILPYGRERLPLPQLTRGPETWLTPSFPPPRPAEDLVREALEQPIDSVRLRDLARGKRTAAILIPGKDRIAGVREFVPLILAELAAAGVPDDGIRIVLAPGTHAHQPLEDLLYLLGEDIFRRYSCHAHDCRDEATLETVGTTTRGTPVQFDRRVLGCEIKVLTGRIVPHYFAGFGGGRKALLPGVAGFRTIVANHKLTLDPVAGIHPMVRPAQLDGNPVHEDMIEAASMARPDFTFNTILDVEERLVAAVAGDVVGAHREGCRLARTWLEREIPGPIDGLITAAGGHPFDINFMQTLKAVVNFPGLVRPGGAILWAGECPAGIHEGFLKWAGKSDAELDRAVRENYDLTGHNSLLLRRIVRDHRVAFLSRLPREVVERLGMTPLKNLEEGLEWLRSELPADARLVVAPHANIMTARSVSA